VTIQIRKGPHIRRIVTRHDANGKATVWIDGPAANHKFSDEKVSSTLMWLTENTPTDYMTEQDAGSRIVGTAPPLGGTRFTILELQPGNELHGQHRTDTIDYCICLSGQVEMLLDDEVVKMSAGDVLIQRGTRHAWVNRGTQPARLAVVLIDGKPKRADSVSGVQQAR
jgi:quercetin dioxygenase-like cupin family protein